MLIIRLIHNCFSSYSFNNYLYTKQQHQSYLDRLYMKKILSTLVLLFLSLTIYSTGSNGYSYKFRLYLKDKKHSKYSLNAPEEFLSIKAIERRERQDKKIDATDLPVSDHYLEKIKATGAIVVAQSKWNNTVAVHLEDSMQIKKLQELDFVTDVKLVWRSAPPSLKIRASSENLKKMNNSIKYLPIKDTIVDNYYGLAYDNIKMLKGDTLHARGYKGDGMTIAVIDAGFNNYPKIEYLDNINLVGYKNFVYENDCLFRQKNQHGLNVISCIATNKPYRFVGTAPNADFWMLGTEDPNSEYPIEEDYWAAAIEYADSLGVDVVNTSLGYTNFDYPTESYTRSSLDGKTAMISRSAEMATKKGMFLVISAGNAGNKAWGKVSAPADAHDILTVGAIQRDSTIAAFSSHGLTADLRIKPDVVALGVNTVLVDDDGTIAMKNGTSFSSPVMCGIAACLWQAFPSLTNYELLDVIRESADRYEDPSSVYGFGIPDMEKAMDLAKKIADQKKK